jgi:hypothetical protein
MTGTEKTEITETTTMKATRLITLTTLAALALAAGLVKNAPTVPWTYLARTALEGFQKNWIPTVPGKSWFTGFRLYAPNELTSREPGRCRISSRSIRNHG